MNLKIEGINFSMSNLIIKNLAKINLYLIFMALPIYYFSRDFLPLASYIFIFLLLSACLICFYINVQKDILGLNIFFVMECLIFLNVLVFFYFINYFEQALIISLSVMYVSRSLFISNTEISSHAPNIVIVSGLIGSLGIMLGLYELLFTETNFFYQTTNFDYPYSDGMNQTILINGFFPSANGSAYCIGASLAFINMQKIFHGYAKKLIYSFLIFCLVVTKTKFAALVFAALLVIYCFKKSSEIRLYVMLLCLAASYIFFSHIVLAPSGTYILPSVHFRELLFSIGDLDFILGNYGIHKIFSFQAISSNLFFPFGLESFEKIYEGRPHFMLGNLIISGGISIALIITAYIVLILIRNFSKIPSSIRRNKIYLSVLFSFLVETINWNFANNFYFWGILFGLFIINIEKEEEVKKISI